MGSLRAVAVAASLLAILLGGCGAAGPAVERSRLRVVAEPQDARVYVDDRFVATAQRLARRPESLRPGVHHVTVSAPDHFPHDVELDLPPGLTTIEISLRPVPP